MSATRLETRIAHYAARYPIEIALRETPNSYPPHSLKLKIGAVIILLVNWAVKDGLCNGTRLRVTHMNLHSIRAAILFGPFKDKEFTFSRKTFAPQNEITEYRLIRTQFPFRLAFAMTINKSQGQTFDRIGILLNTPCFSPGQWYVAASRVRSFDDLKVVIKTILLGNDRQGQIDGFEGCYTKNVVERSILN